LKERKGERRKKSESTSKREAEKKERSESRGEKIKKMCFVQSEGTA
jgi:hypothetical protein